MSRPAVLASSLAAMVCSADLPAARAQPAQPPDRQACVSTYESAQHYQKEGRLVKALEAFTACAQDGCPSVVRQQCALALPELEQSVPSVVFDATDSSGSQIPDVRVTVDGSIAATSLDGRAISLDPGRHVVRFERPGGQAIEQTIVLLEGQRRRQVLAQFGPESTEGTGEPGARPFGVAPWIVAGAGVAVAGAGLVVLVIGQGDIVEAEERCPTRVCADQVAVDLGNGGRSTSVAGKVLLGAGGALVAGGLIWQLGFNQPAGRESAAMSLSMQPSGATLRIRSRF